MIRLERPAWTRLLTGAAGRLRFGRELAAAAATRSLPVHDNWR